MVGGGGRVSVTLAALLAVYTIARCVLCFKILFAIIFIIISDEIFQLSHVIFIIQFLSTKIQNVNQVFFADTCTRCVPIFLNALATIFDLPVPNVIYNLSNDR